VIYVSRLKFQRPFVLLSLFFSIALIVSGLLSNPEASTLRELGSGDISQRVKAGINIVIMFTIASWPWLHAIFRASEDKMLQGIIFSIFSALFALFCRNAIAGAPSEGIGYLVIIYFLATWISYPLLGYLNRFISKL
jgi:hypothetical protein